jgi:formimidoylglutamate deiminase
LHAPWALLPGGWERDVVVDVAADGTIASVAAGQPRNGAADAGGALVPAMPNVHSHAFQRGVAGRTGHAGASGEDSFWTWRQAMYGFLERLDPTGWRRSRRRSTSRWRRPGYGAVAEFHYVHHDPAGQRYMDGTELSKARARRGGARGVADHAAAGLLRARRLQRRAAVAGAATLHDDDGRIRAPGRAIAPVARDAGAVVGIAPHSLRAVTPEELDRVVAAAPPTRRCTSTSPSRRARSRSASRGRASARSNGCSRAAT